MIHGYWLESFKVRDQFKVQGHCVQMSECYKSGGIHFHGVVSRLNCCFYSQLQEHASISQAF